MEKARVPPTSGTVAGALYTAVTVLGGEAAALAALSVAVWQVGRRRSRLSWSDREGGCGGQGGGGGGVGKEEVEDSKQEERCPYPPLAFRRAGGRGLWGGDKEMDCSWKVQNVHYLSSGMPVPGYSVGALPVVPAPAPTAAHSPPLTPSPALLQQVSRRWRTVGVRGCCRERDDGPAARGPPLSSRRSPPRAAASPSPSRPPSAARDSLYTPAVLAAAFTAGFPIA